MLTQLKAMFPAWRQAIKSDSEEQAIKYTWAKALYRAGMGLDDIRRGLDRASREGNQFFPSCGQFIQWCEPEQAEHLPGRHQAYQEACLHQKGGDWSCPAVYHAARRTGLFDLKNQAETKMRPLFFEHYADVCAEIKQGAHLELPAPEEPPNIEAKEKTEADRQYARSQIKAIMQGLGE